MLSPVWKAALPVLRALDSHTPWLVQLRDRWATIAPTVAPFRTSPNPMDRRIELGGRFLAIVQVLEARGVDDATLRRLVLETARALVTPRNRLVRWAWRARTAMLLWPPVFHLLSRKAVQLGSRTMPEGFRVRFVPGRPGEFTFGMDFLACGLCSLFERHGAGRHTRLLCEVDHLTAQLAGLRLARTGTLAEGASHCDFRWSVDGNRRFS
jgi:hypothetical protein